MTKVYETHDWVYTYDRPNRVWRALYLPDGEEINQYHKSELLFLMSHRDDEVTWRQTIKRQVPEWPRKTWTNRTLGESSDLDV